MVMTIDVPENAIREAERQGKSVEVLLRDWFLDSDLTPVGYSGRDPELAAQSIERLSERHTLDGIRMRDLLREGRRS